MNVLSGWAAAAPVRTAVDRPAPSLSSMLRPRRVAVIGASRRPDHIGHQILGNVVRHGFTGTVHPVHPTAHAVHSIRAYPRVADVPEPIDLAVIAVPAPAAVEPCSRSTSTLSSHAPTARWRSMRV